MISYYHEDIFTADETFICHQVNCKGVMGAGLAKQIADKYPLVKERYLEMCKNYKISGNRLLGEYQIVSIGHERTGYEQFVVNIFGQEDYGRSNKVYTDYNALRRALYKLFEMYPSFTYAFPYGMGCGLANGNWYEVEEIIRDTSNRFNVSVTIYWR